MTIMHPHRALVIDGARAIAEFYFDHHDRTGFDVYVATNETIDPMWRNTDPPDIVVPEINPPHTRHATVKVNPNGA